MIGGQTNKPVAAQPIGAAVTDMEKMRGAAAQHQGRKGAAHSGELGIAVRLRKNPAVERVEDPRPGTAHFHRFRQIAEAVEEPAYRGFCGNPAASGTADTVSNCRHHIGPRLRQFRTKHGTAEIFVALARPGFRGKTDACLHCWHPVGHAFRSLCRPLR